MSGTVPRPLYRPQTAQNCSSYRFDARLNILAEMNCSDQFYRLIPRQYLSVNPKKFATPTLPVGGAF